MESAAAEKSSRPTELPPLDTQPLAERIAEIAWDKKALGLRALRVLELVNYTDWFIVMSARSDRHASALREHIEDTLRVEDGRRPMTTEGTERNQWIVIDYGDVVVHIFYEPVRAFYELERLWSEAPELELTPPVEGPQATGLLG
ncbi:MAG: ribosome silencing factor [Myxococcota bacterium]